MPTFQEKMRLLKTMYIFFCNHAASLWPVVQEEAVHQVSVEVQRQIIEQAQQQVSVFCFETCLTFLYNHMFLTSMALVTATFEYFTSLVSEGIMFWYMFGWELFIYTRDFFRASREVNDGVGLTLKDWVYILLAMLFVLFLLFIVFPKIFSILDCFDSEADESEKEIRVTRNESQQRGARGKSPVAKKNETIKTKEK
jgi:hypothetical protein